MSRSKLVLRIINRQFCDHRNLFPYFNFTRLDPPGKEKKTGKIKTCSQNENKKTFFHCDSILHNTKTLKLLHLTRHKTSSRLNSPYTKTNICQLSFSFSFCLLCFFWCIIGFSFSFQNEKKYTSTKLNNVMCHRVIGGGVSGGSRPAAAAER